jgi:F0F1-type ATP synthase membrane subunit b/b'
MHIPPDWGTFFLLIISFLVFWFLFNRLFLQPFLKTLAERQRRIDELGSRAEQLAREAAEAARKRDSELSAARHEAALRRDAERRKAEADAAKLIDEARAKAHESLEGVLAGIAKELRDAEQELESMGQNLAAQLAERVLGRKLDGATNPEHAN